MNEDNEPLKGVKFNIYKSSEDKKQEKIIAKEIQTNSEGIINFDGELGEWYYIKEVKTIPGYEIADPDHKVIHVTKEGKVTEFTSKKNGDYHKEQLDGKIIKFVNKENTNFNITIYKCDENGKKGEKLPGAQFIIYRHIQDDKGSWYRKQDGNYTQEKKQAENKTVKYRREYLRKKNGDEYTYEKVGFDEARNDKKYIFETDGEGKIALKNLKAKGDYFAKEIEAPEGYKKLENPVRLGTSTSNNNETDKKRKYKKREVYRQYSKKC